MHTEYRFLFLKLPFNKKSLPHADYISVFRQLQVIEGNRANGTEIEDYVYDINLWYGNKHIKL